MKTEVKGMFLVWGFIIVVIYILTRAIYGFYMVVIFDHLSRYLGSSLTMALFWVGWILLLIKTLDVIIKWCVFNDDI
jgi:hypothetical protein